MSVVVIAALAIFWAGGMVRDYFDPDSPANAAMQVQLRLFGSATYEYHAQTGRWPVSINDLAQTSLPLKSRVWRQAASSIVFLWPRDLNSDSKTNANILLAHWKGGLFNEFGRVWVCWGDLRTERMKESELRARLRAIDR
jgi:hypothetical protein